MTLTLLAKLFLFLVLVKSFQFAMIRILYLVEDNSKLTCLRNYLI